MSVHDENTHRYSELRSKFKCYIDTYNALYQLKTKNKDDLHSIYKMIKTELIDSKKCLPQILIKDILNIIPFNTRYTNSYLKLAKLIYDEYQIEEVYDISSSSLSMFYYKYDIKLQNEDYDYGDFLFYLLLHSENSIFRLIMDDNLEQFISFTERAGFDKDQRFEFYLQEFSGHFFSLLELCCYYGSVRCFKFLRTKFNSEISYRCLKFSFLGGNQEIMSECLKYNEPYGDIMKYAIISHNIDFVTFLMNEYNISIDLECCVEYNNLESFLVAFDQNFSLNHIDECFYYSTTFNIPPLWEYFLSLGANINAKFEDGFTALYNASRNDEKETVEFLLSHGANPDEEDLIGDTALLYAIYLENKEIIELLLLHGADVKQNRSNKLPLHRAASQSTKEIVELIISYGANVNVKDNYKQTALRCAMYNKNIKEIVEILLSHGANVNE
ncbi:hypothetical protein TVAG_205980 [Trichomonas vaginalis G3]|uniref:DUF3447 domain-containing protein n=1 Tax=Trichomonas vaginalis (strain ATCC PRA-98 / G3) TaxID=412133 RepID=A2E1I3_TRIV3|nr:nerve growth factor signaling pathway [Trichomonas vaginalis G3]EAY13430.1 hypothetical protein TVAG_205980 [Trichomonas vaginalis G3]KAI5518386.1 nerve growth factor signaling pathway [Trichomonas vaginalis G3]|eukprot:XP_001325653.1 hypothetical protein [Trichomonas vaginalis G3]